MFGVMCRVVKVMLSVVSGSCVGVWSHFECMVFEVLFRCLGSHVHAGFQVCECVVGESGICTVGCMMDVWTVWECGSVACGQQVSWQTACSHGQLPFR